MEKPKPPPPPKTVAPPATTRKQRRHTLRRERDFHRHQVAKLRAELVEKTHEAAALRQDLTAMARGVVEQAPAGELREFSEKVLARLGIEPKKEPCCMPGLAVVEHGKIRQT